MTMPDDAPPRKPKPRRWGLYAPFIALVLAAVAWCGYWFVARAQLETRLAQGAADLRASGYQAGWRTMTVAGFPFRLEVELVEPHLQEPSGWGIAAPRIKALANAYDLNHWMFVASDGLVLARPGAGKVAIGGQFLRASLSDLSTAPRFAFEGETMTFAPAPGAATFPLTAADRIDIHLLTAEPDRLRLQWRLTNAQVQRAGVLARIAPLAPLNITVAADIAKRSAFRGSGWESSARNWAGQGGSATVSRLVAAVGDVSLEANGGPLTAGADGRLSGALDLSLRQGAAALAVLGAPQAGGTGLHLTFQDGETTLGPIRIGPSPRIY